MNTLFDLSRPAVNPVLVNERIMAIDFGKNGGFAWNFGEHLITRPMPDDTGDIAFLIHEVRPDKIYGENVHAFPGQGVVSVGTFMEDAGFVKGVCAAYHIPVELIEPKAWVMWYNIGKRSDFKRPGGENDTKAWKKHLQEQAQRLFPSADISLKVADAVLIWNYVNNPQRIAKLRPPQFK